MINISKKLFNRIIEHSKKEFPNEVCGILAGPPSCIGLRVEDSLRRITKIYEMTNTDKSAATFFMDAKEQLNVMKDMRTAGLEMLGIYHSHVASQAYPSAHDVEMAFYPEVSYVIVSLQEKDNPNIRSFKIKDGKISEEEIRIEKER